MASKKAPRIFLKEIDLLEGTYTLKVSVHNNLIIDDDYSFVLENRQTSKEITVNVLKKERTKERTVLFISFNINDHLSLLSSQGTWDLSFFTKIETEFKKYRIKNNLTEIQYRSVYIPLHNLNFYPYTTNKGNLSFHVNENVLFTITKDVELNELGELQLSGYYYLPTLFMKENKGISHPVLIITTELGVEEIHIPMEQFVFVPPAVREKNLPHLDIYSFETSIDLKDYFIEEQRNYLKLFIELTSEQDGEIQTIRSLRMQAEATSNTLKNTYIKQAHKKYRINIKPTKHMQYLSISIVDYILRREIKKMLTSSWVAIRRSKTLKNLYALLFFVLGKVVPVKNNLVVFESFLGKQYSDNPRAIYDYMKIHYPQYNMYWSVDRQSVAVFENKDVKYVRRFSVKWLFLMTRAKYWVTNSRLPIWIPKPRQTVYLQTWHGTPLKRLAADMEEVHMPGTNTEKYKENFLLESSKWDYLISPNAYSTHIFKRAFDFNKKVIESGYPRNDLLIQKNNEVAIREIKERNNLPLHKKVILYAPTWRDNQFYARGKYKFDLELDLQAMYEKLGHEYIIILRMHYLVAENLDLSGHEGFAYDFSLHEDIRELYLVSDLLITDYSSVFFDYANLKRPMIFYTYDIEEYRDNLRGFYFDFESNAPGLLTKSTGEVIEEIRRIDEEGFVPTKEIQAFYEKFCYLEDGDATKRVVEQIFSP